MLCMFRIALTISYTHNIQQTELPTYCNLEVIFMYVRIIHLF